MLDCAWPILGSGEAFFHKIQKSAHSGWHMSARGVIGVKRIAFIRPFGKNLRERATLEIGLEPEAVSYTHLDVYKRQPIMFTPNFHLIKNRLRLF